VSIAVVLGALVGLFMASAVAFVVVALATGVDLQNVVNDQSILAQPGFVLLNNLLLAALIRIAMAGVWAGHLWRPRWVSSVAGGVRWRWLGECAVISLALMVVSSVVLYAIDGWPQGAPEKQAVVLLLIVFLTTPFQAAGEEYFMRGWMTQTVGALFARPVVGAVVAGLSSSTVFALAHGSQNAWLFADRFAFGAIASYLTWRTGGLEAAVAAHAVNNLVVFVPVILTGGLQESLLISEAPAGVVALDVVSLAILAAVLLWWGRRRGVQRLYRPGPPPQPVASWQPAVQGPPQPLPPQQWPPQQWPAPGQWQGPGEPPGEPPVLVDPDRLR
jgi:membrane protease YdiL (CAAX protease family)